VGNFKIFIHYSLWWRRCCSVSRYVCNL